MRIDEMPAGREMDALIAEKVMGFSLTGDVYIKLFDVESKKPSGYVKSVPPYSSDIAAAWEVVKWMKDWNFTLDWLGSDWQAMFQTDEDGEFFVNAETAPLAICRAALKAMGVVEI